MNRLIASRVSDEVYNWLEEKAQKEDRKKSYIVARILRERMLNEIKWGGPIDPDETKDILPKDETPFLNGKDYCEKTNTKKKEF